MESNRRLQTGRQLQTATGSYGQLQTESVVDRMIVLQILTAISDDVDVSAKASQREHVVLHARTTAHIAQHEHANTREEAKKRAHDVIISEPSISLFLPLLFAHHCR